MHKIKIGGERNLSDIKGEFNAIFPYLKIEFFKEPCTRNVGFTKSRMITGEEKINQLNRRIKNGDLTFSNNTTVEELEQKIFKRFGLCVQVFRKSGKIWLETTATDNWTLEQQNEEGKSLAQHLKIE